MTNKYSEEGTQGSQKITLTDFTDDDVHDCDHVNNGDSDVVMKILQRAVICSAVRRNKP